MMKKTFFFDLDGTLTDPAEGITRAVAHALSCYGIHVPEPLSLAEKFVGPPLAEGFQQYYGFSAEESYRAIDRFREYFREKGIFENRLYEGVPALLESLKAQGHAVVLATSKPEEFAHRILKHFDLFSYFDFAGGATMDERSRVSKEQVLSYAMESSGAAAARSFMIGDRDLDILAGKVFSLSTVGVLYGYGSREELTAAGADALCETVGALSEVLLS